MSRFNQYLWHIYSSGEGRKTVEVFKKFLNGDFGGYTDYVKQLMRAYCPDEEWIEETCYSIKETFELIAKREIQVTAGNCFVEGEEKHTQETYNAVLSEYYQEYLNAYQTPVQAQWYFSQDLGGISTELSYEYPESFIPYYFPACFNIVQRIAAYFDIELPSIPAKGQKEKRVQYYGAVSQAFTKFRNENDLKPEELWALLLDYAPKVVGGLDWVVPVEELKEPHNVFVFGVNEQPRLSTPNTGTIFLWQGNPDMQPGDIAVLYNWAPASKFVSVWRAVSAGYNDPIFRHHRIVCYSAVAPIPPVTYKELQQDELFSGSPLVRAKMTFMDGAPLPNKLYMHLLELSAVNGTVPSEIPIVPVFNEIEVPELKLEKDVEKYLLEDQLLKRLGWNKGDYSRQVPVRIGRGVTKYPDYVINYDDIHKKAEIILEAKLSIKTRKQAMHDKGQARSYAKLLDARAIVLVAKEGIWIGEQIDDYDKMTAYTWGEIQSAEVFDKVYQIIGKGKKGKKRH